MEIPRNFLQARILNQVRRIPRGRVATYGQIAALAGHPRNARQVGAVLRALPPDSDVPWHRVINAAGQISQRGGGTGEQIQQALLESEGVWFDEQRNRIDLSVFQWKSP